MTNDAQMSSSEQSALWNGSSGRAWVDLQDLLDRVFQPFEELLVDAVSPETTAALLDVGCGTGATTLALARRLGPRGSATGVDISAPMIALARARAERATPAPAFVVADAETHPFEPAHFDAVVSRFGVMFFPDPVRAFRNLRGAARDGARLTCIVWRSPAENPFMTAAERAAAPLLPELPPRRPDEPGQFAFADPDRVRGILQASGWSSVDLRAIDVPCAMPEDRVMDYATRLGPVGRLLQQPTDGDLRARVVDAVGAALRAYVHGAELRFVGACWLISARA